MIRAILAGAMIAGIVALLTGCDLGIKPMEIDTGYTDCINYTVLISDYKHLDLVDSSATCWDGSKPFMAKAEWLSTDSTCPSNIYTLVGGLQAIHHTYGCWPKPKPEVLSV